MRAAVSRREPPLVSLVIVSYQQESLVAEAVNAALSQTYHPLEIVVSDDNSCDRTFEVVEELAAKYHGPHRLVLNRNSQNLFIPRHINEIMSIAQGELIVIAAGDDISVPDRVEQIVSEWTAGGRKRVLLGSGYELINQRGDSLGIRPVGPPSVDRSSLVSCLHASFQICGATHAWHRDVFHAFGPFSAKRPSEDSFLFMRACILDGFIPVNRTLLKYRVRDKHRSLSSLRGSVLYQRRGWPHTYRQWKKTCVRLQHANSLEKFRGLRQWPRLSD
jgi:glycosyltransferase involved in cell wall biosynthesis